MRRWFGLVTATLAIVGVAAVSASPTPDATAGAVIRESYLQFADILATLPDEAVVLGGDFARHKLDYVFLTVGH